MSRIARGVRAVRDEPRGRRDARYIAIRQALEQRQFAKNLNLVVHLVRAATASGAMGDLLCQFGRAGYIKSRLL